MAMSHGEHLRCPEGAVLHNRYRIVKEIGSGNFAKVYKCRDTHSPCETFVAVKVVKREYARDASFENSILRAVLGHTHTNRDFKVVSLLESFSVSHHPCFAFTLHGPSLRSRQAQMGLLRGSTTMSQIHRFALDMVRTLATLHHDIKVVHTDLKPENILLECDPLVMMSSQPPPESAHYPRGRATSTPPLPPGTPPTLVASGHTATAGIGQGWVIADFGSASFYHHAKPDSDLISTRPYRAPEVILGLPWSCKADMWSLGCILFELFTGSRLFNVQTDMEHLAAFERRLGSLPLTVTRKSRHFRRLFDACGAVLTSCPVGGARDPLLFAHEPKSANGHLRAVAVRDTIAIALQSEPNFCEFVLCLLQYDPDQRMSATDALNHPFVKSMRHSGSRSSGGVSPVGGEAAPLAVPGEHMPRRTSDSSADSINHHRPGQLAKIDPPPPSATIASAPQPPHRAVAAPPVGRPSYAVVAAGGGVPHTDKSPLHETLAAAADQGLKNGTTTFIRGQAGGGTMFGGRVMEPLAYLPPNGAMRPRHPSSPQQAPWIIDRPSPAAAPHPTAATHMSLRQQLCGPTMLPDAGPTHGPPRVGLPHGSSHPFAMATHADPQSQRSVFLHTGRRMG